MADTAVKETTTAQKKAPDFAAMQEQYSQIETLRGWLMTARAPYQDLWYRVQFYLDPQSVIWDPSTAGFPNFSNILRDCRPFQSFDDMVAGMCTGMTPATQEWQQVAPEEEGMEQDEQTMEWCRFVTQLYKWTYLKSNFYQQIASFWRYGGKFLTGAMMIEEDFKTRCRFTVFPIGSFYCSNNEAGLVDTFIYETRLKLRQVVEKFCTSPDGTEDLSNLDSQWAEKWKDVNQHETPINLVYCIRPNQKWDERKAKFNQDFKHYKAQYVIRDSAEKKILETKGFDEFPIVVFRWWRQFTDAYGIDGPGWKALGPTAQVYEEVRLKLNALQKMIEPPMKASSDLAGYPTGTTPGFLTIVPKGSEQHGFGPAYQIEPKLQEIREDINELASQIDDITLAKVFRMMARMSDQKQPPTATQIMQTIQENYNVLGPMFGNADFEVFQPMFKIMFGIFMKQGAIPPAPPQLAGQPLKMKLVSRVAMALKLVETSSYREVLAFTKEAEELQPGIKDNMNWDKFFRRFAINNNLPADLLNDEKVTAQIRQTQAKQLQQGQAAERLPAVAAAAKDLSQAGITQGQGGAV